jgi:hypothetical protein
LKRSDEFYGNSKRRRLSRERKERKEEKEQ